MRSMVLVATKIKASWVLVTAAAVGAAIYILIAQGVIPNLFKTKPKVKLTTQYKNPFDKGTQYVNPFSRYKNPFDIIR